MKARTLIITGILLWAAQCINAQELPPDTLPVFLADSLKTVYIYADTGTALNHADSQGRKQGLWEKRYPDGHLKYRGHFWNNVPTGVFKNYYDTGDSLEAIRVFSDSGKVTYAHLFYITGALYAQGKYVNEKKDSIWKYYDDRQRLVLKNQYVNGKREGKSVIFYPDGNVLEIKNWENGLEEGPFEQYFDEGGVKEDGTYIDGKLEDTLYVYEPDGKISIKGRYVNDVHEGKWIYYYDGAPKDTLIYHRGECLNCYKYELTPRQEDSLKLHYQQLQQELDQPKNLEEEYEMPGEEGK